MSSLNLFVTSKDNGALGLSRGIWDNNVRVFSITWPSKGAAVVLTRTRPELNFALVPVPEPPMQSCRGTGTGTRLCHWYQEQALSPVPEPVPGSVNGTGIVARACKNGSMTIIFAILLAYQVSKIAASNK